MSDGYRDRDFPLRPGFLPSLVAFFHCIQPRALTPLTFSNRHGNNQSFHVLGFLLPFTSTVSFLFLSRPHLALLMAL
jgi:hypothetical protein